MTTALPATPGPLPRPFALAHTLAPHWAAGAKTCLDGVAHAAANANIGFLYVTEPLADDLASALTFLRETTRIAHWVGAAVPGLYADGTEYRQGGAMAVLVGTLPGEAFALLDGTRLSALSAPPGAAGGGLLLHADPRFSGLAPLVAQLAQGAAWVAGGVVADTAGRPSQIADTPTKGLSGLRLDPGVTVASGLTQGCAPIGPTHAITAAQGTVLMTLDGRPALEVLKEEAGELIARDLRRAAGYIHAALPVEGSFPANYLVRSLIGIDPRQGWLAIGEDLTPGARLLFVRRDANTARADLRRMLADIHTQLDGRPAMAALYIGCTARGAHMFGQEGIEAQMVRDSLDGAPLIGFFANGEIAGAHLYGYTGVLLVLAGERPPFPAGKRS